MSALAPILNFVEVVVSGLYAAGVTTVNLQAGEGASLPQPSSAGEFWLVWWNATDYSNPGDDPNVEIVRVTARSTDQLTVVRGADGSADTAKNTADKTYHMRLAPTAALFGQIKRRTLGLDTTASVTISSGAVTKDASVLLIAGEGAAADDLTDINAASGWTLESGEVVLIRPSAGTYDITIKSTGNITAESEDLILYSTDDYALFIYIGSSWRLIAWNHYNSMWVPFSGDSDGEMYTEREVFISAPGLTPGTFGGYNLVVESTNETPIAINRNTDDGELIRFHQAGTYEGDIAVSGTTVSYNGFLGGHPGQFKVDRDSPPDGAVIIGLSEMIESEIEYYEEEKEVDQINPETGETERVKHVIRHFKEDDLFRPSLGWKRVERSTSDISTNRLFPYIEGTTIPNDPRAYGVYLCKRKRKPTRSSFGKNDLDHHVSAAIGLYKIRVTDTGGNVAAGDYLSSSSRLWEAQKQSDDLLHNYTIAKALTDVDFSTVAVDPALGYKWILIPCTLHCG